MKSGTPGFVPERLRSAREARGLTAASLAELIGVSRTAISQYENDRQTPSPDTLRAIADKLNVPEHYFVLPSETAERGIVFYRSLSSATKAARTRAERKYEWVRGIAKFLRGYIKFPEIKLPELNLGSGGPTTVSDDDLEDAATCLRQEWSLGDDPIANLVAIMESKGVIATKFEMEASKLDAFSEWCDRQPYVVLNAEKASAVRSRFDAAHELAHLLLHHGVEQSTFNNKSTFALMEAQANRFAGALLLPEREFTRDLHSISLDGFRALKPKWRASIGVMIKRVAHLGVISAEDERRLWMNYGRRGWRRHEPLDDKLPPELPRFLRRSVELLVDKELVTREQLPFLLALPAADIAHLLGLPEDYFEHRPEIRLQSDEPRILPFKASD